MLRQRVITALVLTPIVLGVVLWASPATTAAVLTLIVMGAAWEWSAFPGFRRRSMRALYVALFAMCIGAAWVLGVHDTQLDAVLYAAIGWWALALLWLATAAAAVNWGIASAAGFFVLIPAWLALARLHANDPQLLLFLLLLVVAADIGAYFAGRKFGKHKLAPRVSPGKTWEGVFGGLAAAAVMALIGVYWFEVNTALFISLCAIVVIASIVGDLTESLFKRHAGLKDSGNLLPGHGGLLDRVDSLTAAAPVFLVGLERLGFLR
jgi:phosphatidate cytidylyltransferase